MKYPESWLTGSSKGEAIACELRLQIICGTIRHEEVLSENRIAMEFNVSRSPVREAFKVLASEGLITLQRMGAIVNGMTQKDLHELYDVRYLIERFAWQRLTQQDHDSYITKLQHIIDKMELACKYNDAAEFALQDLAFHEVIIAAADHTRILHLWRSIRQIIMAVMLITTEAVLAEGEERVNEVINKHRKLLEGFKTSDSALISAEVEQYFTDSHLTLKHSIPLKGED